MKSDWMRDFLGSSEGRMEKEIQSLSFFLQPTYQVWVLFFQLIFEQQ